MTPEAGLAQARHVFLAGNRIPERWQGRERFVILETGFGIGLNFLATWDALRADPRGPARLHFVSVEARPIASEGLQSALAPFDALAPLATALVASWPMPVAGFHRLLFDGGRVTLTLLLGEARTLLPQLDAQADALFLDGHARARDPGFWSLEVIRELARLASPGATLATGNSAQGVREALAGSGFRVERAAGIDGKRERLTGVREGEASVAGGRVSGPRHAAIVGAGLAGCLCAERLAARGWSVTVVDAQHERTSAPAGLLRPVANLRDAVNAQLSRPAFLYALHHLRSLQRDGYHPMWFPSGVLQLAGGDDEARRMAAIAAAQVWPAEMLRFVEAEAAASLAGRPVRGPGWWISAGAWVSPSSLMSAALARGGGRVTLKAGRAVAAIEREPSAWVLRDERGGVITEAAVVIVANAHRASRLVPAARLGITPVRGQVTHLPADARRSLGVAVSGMGYVSPTPDGGHVIGASFDNDDESASLRDHDHVDNLARAESMLPGFTAGVNAASLGGWAGVRATVRDRLPIVGEGIEPGLWFATGLGSRGLLWAPLGAELIAGDLDGDPRPLPRLLAGALSPRRFLS